MSKDQVRLLDLLESVGKVTITLAAAQVEINHILLWIEKEADAAGFEKVENETEVGMN